MPYIIKSILLTIAGWFIIPSKYFPVIFMKAIPHASSMPCITRSIQRYVTSKIYLFTITCNACLPFPILMPPSNTHMSTRIKRTHALIPMIFYRCNFSYILPSIIIPNMIYMVNFIRRKTSIYIQKCNAMCHIFFIHYAQLFIPIRIKEPTGITRMSCIPRITCSERVEKFNISFLPCKYASIGIVIKKFFQSFLSKFHSSLQSVIHPVRQGNYSLPHRLDVMTV